LEPLKPEKKAMWKREMKVLLSVCEYIQEFAPTAQYLEDGTIVEVGLVHDNHNFNGTFLASSLNLYNVFFQMMKSRPRSDIYINLPALQKLDAMLIVRQTSIACCIEHLSFCRCDLNLNTTLFCRKY